MKTVGLTGVKSGTYTLSYERNAIGIANPKKTHATSHSYLV